MGIIWSLTNFHKFCVIPLSWLLSFKLHLLLRLLLQLSLPILKKQIVLYTGLVWIIQVHGLISLEELNTMEQWDLHHLVNNLPHLTEALPLQSQTPQSYFVWHLQQIWVQDTIQSIHTNLTRTSLYKKSIWSQFSKLPIYFDISQSP